LDAAGEVEVEILFGPVTLDERARQLLKGTQPLHLSPKAFDLLALLVTRAPEAFSKADLHRHLWPDTYVSDVNLAVLVAEIRAALGDEARSAAFVRTVHRFGYAFATAVTQRTVPRARRPDAAACWVAWGTQRAALASGENLVGRDPGADIHLDAVGVSRRHALIVVADQQVTIQDLSSKNGTYVDSERVASPVALRDGAEIRVGPVPLQFRRQPPALSTQSWDAFHGPSQGR
jgi:DNA-binding winged helix-turn-helix (wHTH) protein